MTETWHVNAQREIWSDTIGIRLGVRGESGFAVAMPPTMQVIDPGSLIHPTLRLPLDAAQRLMDELWQAGVKPSQSIGSTGQVEAIKYHLEDMRKLVFKESK
jgi:glycine cleavage system aminomethyltransferase T